MAKGQVGSAVAIDRRLPESVEIAFYYVAAEALANVAKYAQATTAAITVTATDEHATLSVTDDGIGGAGTARGTGLAGLADRLGAIGGNLSLSSTPGTGTTVTATAPLSLYE